MPVSLNPKTFSSGGLLNDADVEIVSSRFVLYDYNGTITDPQQISVALHLVMRTLDSGEEYSEYFSFGRSPDWMIDDEGRTVESVSGKRPNSNSVFAMFIQSLIDAGYDASNLDSGDISVLEGLRVHVVRRAAPESWKSLPGMKKDDSKREKTYLAVEKILSDAGKAGAAKTAQKPAVRKFDPALVKKVEEAVVNELPADGQPMKVKALQISVLRRKDLSPDDKKAINDAIQQGILAELDTVKVEGDSVSLSVF